MLIFTLLPVTAMAGNCHASHTVNKNIVAKAADVLSGQPIVQAAKTQVLRASAALCNPASLSAGCCDGMAAMACCAVGIIADGTPLTGALAAQKLRYPVHNRRLAALFIPANFRPPIAA